MNGIRRKPYMAMIFDAIAHVERRDMALLEIDPVMSIVNKIPGKKLPGGLHPFEPDDKIEPNLRMGNDMVYISLFKGRQKINDRYRY